MTELTEKQVDAMARTLWQVAVKAASADLAISFCRKSEKEKYNRQSRYVLGLLLPLAEALEERGYHEYLCELGDHNANTLWSEGYTPKCTCMIGAALSKLKEVLGD